MSHHMDALAHSLSQVHQLFKDTAVDGLDKAWAYAFGYFIQAMTVTCSVLDDALSFIELIPKRLNQIRKQNYDFHSEVLSKMQLIGDRLSEVKEVIENVNTTLQNFKDYRP